MSIEFRKLDRDIDAYYLILSGNIFGILFPYENRIEISAHTSISMVYWETILSKMKELQSEVKK